MEKGKDRLDAYLRVSQKKKREGETYIAPAIQRDAIKKGAELYGVSLGVERFDENVSGAKPAEERPGLEELLQRVEAGQSRGIIVSSVDRLTRGSKLVEAEIFDRLLKADARFIAVSDGIDTGRGGDESEFTLDMLAALARREWKRYRRIWKESRERAVERGVHPCPHVPTGYLRTVIDHKPNGNPVHGPLAIDPVTAPVIRELFKLRRSGGSWSQCCRLLEEARVPNRKGELHWTHSSARRVIENPAYTGQARHGEFVNEDAHEAIIEPALWKAVQPKEPGVLTRSNDGALCAGVVYCSCGRRMVPSISDGRYRCRPRMITGPPCEAPATAKMADADELATDVLFLVLHGHTPESTPADLEPLEAEVTRRRTALQKFADAVEADDDAGAEALAALKAKRAAVEAAEAALFEAREAAGLDHEAVGLAERWGTLSIPERRRWLVEWGVRLHIRRGREGLLERTTPEYRHGIPEGWDTLPHIKAAVESEAKAA